MSAGMQSFKRRIHYRVDKGTHILWTYPGPVILNADDTLENFEERVCYPFFVSSPFSVSIVRIALIPITCKFDRNHPRAFNYRSFVYRAGLYERSFRGKPFDMLI